MLTMAQRAAYACAEKDNEITIDCMHSAVPFAFVLGRIGTGMLLPAPEMDAWQESSAVGGYRGTPSPSDKCTLLLGAFQCEGLGSDDAVRRGV